MSIDLVFIFREAAIVVAFVNRNTTYQLTQAALSQMEAGGKRLRKITLEKLAGAMGSSVELIR